VNGPELAGASIEAAVEETARAYAKRWNLIGTDGQIWCAACVERHALIPSLHCGVCLGAFYARNHITAPSCLNHSQDGA
jgi:hypothetical protein